MMFGSLLIMSANAIVLVCSSYYPARGEEVGMPRTTTITFEQKKQKLKNVSVENGPNGISNIWKAKFSSGGISLTSRSPCNEHGMHVDLQSDDRASLNFTGWGRLCATENGFWETDMDGTCRVQSGDFSQLKAYIRS
jgi:hypothetical protein